jgi:iron complex transport system substrate-binding protein
MALSNSLQVVLNCDSRGVDFPIDLSAGFLLCAFVLLCETNSGEGPMNEELERIASDVVDASMKLHKALGPGLLESVYRVILQKKLIDRGYRVKKEEPIPVVYEGIQFEMGFRADLLINECFIVELKSISKLAPVHAKQLLTYLKLTGFRLGLLINFGEELLKTGIKRVAN